MSYNVIVKYNDGSIKVNSCRFVDIKNAEILFSINQTNAIEIQVLFLNNGIPEEYQVWIKTKSWWKLFSKSQWKKIK